MFDPGLEISNDVLIIQTAQVSDFAANTSIFLRFTLVRKDYFLDGVDVSVEFVTGLTDDTKPTSSNFFNLLKVSFVARCFIDMV